MNVGRLAVVVLQHVAVAPCSTPGRPKQSVAEWSPGCVGSSARLDADQGHRCVGHEGKNMPAALLPPPTQATTASGSRPNCSSDWARVSRPMIDWKSRTIGERVRADDRAEAVVGGFNGAHPVAEGLVDRVA